MLYAWVHFSVEGWCYVQSLGSILGAYMSVCPVLVLVGIEFPFVYVIMHARRTLPFINWSTWAKHTVSASSFDVAMSVFNSVNVCDFDGYFSF